MLNLLHMWMIHISDSLHWMISDKALYLSYILYQILPLFFFCLFVLTKQWFSLKWEFIIYTSALHSMSNMYSAHFTLFFSDKLGKNKFNLPPLKAAEGIQPILTHLPPLSLFSAFHCASTLYFFISLHTPMFIALYYFSSYVY